MFVSTSVAEIQEWIWILVSLGKKGKWIKKWSRKGLKLWTAYLSHINIISCLTSLFSFMVSLCTKMMSKVMITWLRHYWCVDHICESCPDVCQNALGMTCLAAASPHIVDILFVFFASSGVVLHHQSPVNPWMQKTLYLALCLPQKNTPFSFLLKWILYCIFLKLGRI